MPDPMLVIGERDASTVEPQVNRVTFRSNITRERASEEYDTFPSNDYLGSVLKLEHFSPAYIMPDYRVDGSDAIKIDTGWIKSPTVVSLLNKTRWKQPFQPSKEEIEFIEACIILIGFSQDVFPLQLAPRQVQHLFLRPGAEVWIKLNSQDRPVTLSVFAC